MRLLEPVGLPIRCRREARRRRRPNRRGDGRGQLVAAQWSRSGWRRFRPRAYSSRRRGWVHARHRDRPIAGLGCNRKRILGRARSERRGRRARRLPETDGDRGRLVDSPSARRRRGWQVPVSPLNAGRLWSGLRSTRVLVRIDLAVSIARKTNIRPRRRRRCRPIGRRRIGPRVKSTHLNRRRTRGRAHRRKLNRSQ